MVQELFKILFRIVFGTIFFLTGELLLYAVTLGKRKPRWDFYTNEKSGYRFYMLSEISELLGLLFWIAVVVITYKMIHKSN